MRIKRLPSEFAMHTSQSDEPVTEKTCFLHGFDFANIEQIFDRIYTCVGVRDGAMEAI